MRQPLIAIAALGLVACSDSHTTRPIDAAVDAPADAASGPCGSGQILDPLTQQCATACQSDSGCQSGWACDCSLGTGSGGCSPGVCRPRCQIGCTQTTQCDIDGLCRPSAFLAGQPCGSSRTCPTALACDAMDQTCEQACQNDACATSDLGCVAGFCRLRCTTACPSGESCLGGYCYVPPTGTSCPPCSAPNSATVCVTGIVRNFITDAILQSTSGARVRVYDPIAFVTDPMTAPLAETDIHDDGCFVVDGLPRPSSGLIAVAIDDVDQTADASFATMAVGAILVPNQNLTALTVWALEHTQLAAWQTDLGADVPQGCSGGLAGCGLWIGEYLDRNLQPVQNVVPVRPGDPINPGNLFCFTGASRATMQLSATQKATDAVGLCIISPDDLVGHSGVCGTAGCLCGGSLCSPQPSWLTLTGGTALGVVFYQRFVSP